MSFIYGDKLGQVYAPGWFLAHEECERKTKTISATGVVADAYGHKHVPMGTLYSVTTGEGQSAVTDSGLKGTIQKAFTNAKNAVEKGNGKATTEMGTIH